jgi:hypothetical protein
MSDADPIAERLYDAFLAAHREAGDDHALAEALDLLAVRTGQNTIRHAAAIIRGKAVGRKAIDDRAELRRIAAFAPDQRREAVGIVAAQMAKASGKRADSIERRLHRKLAKNEKDKTVLSVATTP